MLAKMFQYFDQVRTAFGNLSTDELKELLNDDERLDERINGVLKSLKREKQVAILQNREIAEGNLNKEPETIERKTRIDTLTERGQSLYTSIQDLLNELKLREGEKTPHTTLALLQVAAAQCEEKSKDIAFKLQSAEITIDEYLEQFNMERKLMHFRNLKIKRMREILQK